MRDVAITDEDRALNKEFIVAQFQHMVFVCSTYLFKLYGTEEHGVNIPMFLDDQLKEKVKQQIVEVTEKGQLPSLYKIAWEVVKDEIL